MVKSDDERQCDEMVWRGLMATMLLKAAVAESLSGGDAAGTVNDIVQVHSANRCDRGHRLRHVRKRRCDVQRIDHMSVRIYVWSPWVFHVQKRRKHKLLGQICRYTLSHVRVSIKAHASGISRLKDLPLIYRRLADRVAPLILAG